MCLIPFWFNDKHLDDGCPQKHVYSFKIQDNFQHKGNLKVKLRKITFPNLKYEHK